MKCLNRIIGVTAAASIGILVTFGAAFAQIGPDPQTNARHSRIVGIWDAQVTLANCVTGAVLTTFPGLHKYEYGGTGQVVPGTNPAGLSAHMMIWNHVEGNDYQMSFKMYRFDGAGNRTGWSVVTFEISIDEDAEEYTGTGVAQTFDLNGNVIGGGCPTLVGTRFAG